ncbi:MAG: barstar family protein [Sporichthyaceae bacterium]
MAGETYEQARQAYLGAVEKNAEHVELFELARRAVVAAQAEGAHPSEATPTLWRNLASAHYAASWGPSRPNRQGRAFGLRDAFEHPLDFQIAQQDGVALYWSRAILAEAVHWFLEAGYHLVRIDTARWESPAVAHDDLSSCLEFPAYYGRNMMALADCLSDVARGDYGWPAQASGLLVVFDNYHVPLQHERAFAEAVLDVIAGCSANAALVGNRVLCLVQTNDPRTQLGPGTPRQIGWSLREHFDRTRGV